MIWYSPPKSDIWEDVGRQIPQTLCEEKKAEILGAQACPDHFYMRAIVLPYLSIAQFMEYLTEKNDLMIFDRRAN